MIKRPALTFIFSSAMVFGFAATAGAQDCSVSPVDDECVDTPVEQEQPTDFGVLPSSPGTDTAAPAGPVVVKKQTLPVTGSETTALALGGLVLVSAGGALVWRSNRTAA